MANSANDSEWNERQLLILPIQSVIIRIIRFIYIERHKYLRIQKIYTL